MDLPAFRRHAHELVDWMADLLETVEARPVVPGVAPGDVRRRLPAAPPEAPEPFDAVFRDFREIVVPGMTLWNHPGWFAYFPANNSPPSILAEMLTATLGAQCMSWQTSPAATELEQVVMDWLRQLLGLPEAFTGVIQDTASTATLVALLTAREEATGHRYGLDGAGAPQADRLVVYASTEAHSSVDKAVKLAGYGLNRLHRVPVDEAFALRPDALREAMAADRAAGLVPACVVATVGTTSSGAVDPLPEIGRICAEHGAWLHVDAAYAGSAALLPERRWILDGIEHADSFLFNPHKWLLTNFDCTAYLVRDPDALQRTFRASPEYLKTAHDPEVVNFRDWGVQLGRRFRALKLWFVLRTYGAEGLRELLRRHLALAEGFRARAEAEPGFEVMAPAHFGLVVLRHVPPGLSDAEVDAHNARLLERVNADGRVHLTHTRLGGRYAIRMSIGQWMTGPEHVDTAWALLREAAAEA